MGMCVCVYVYVYVCVDVKVDRCDRVVKTDVPIERDCVCPSINCINHSYVVHTQVRRLAFAPNAP